MKIDYGMGGCHILTAAFLRLVPMGEPVGLFLPGTDEIMHSAFRLPHTDIYVDAYGAETLRVKASRFDTPGEWRTLRDEDVALLAAGGSRSRLSRLVRSALPVAREILIRAEGA